MNAYVNLKFLSDKISGALTPAEVELVLTAKGIVAAKTRTWGRVEDGSLHTELQYPESVEKILGKAINFEIKLIQTIIGREFQRPRL